LSWLQPPALGSSQPFDVELVFAALRMYRLWQPHKRKSPVDVLQVGNLRLGVAALAGPHCCVGLQESELVELAVRVLRRGADDAWHSAQQQRRRPALHRLSHRRVVELAVELPRPRESPALRAALRLLRILLIRSRNNVELVSFRCLFVSACVRC
jgi:hypothetical protein